MGCFSQKGLCYSFEIMQGLLNDKNNKISMKKIFGGSPLFPPINPILTGKWENLEKSTLQAGVPKISSSADVGLSGGSCVPGHGSEDPHWH